MSDAAKVLAARARWRVLAGTFLILGGCGEVPTDPPSSDTAAPELASASVPFHDHDVDLSFSGVIPCADFGIDVPAEFDYDITADVAFFPNRNVFRIHFRQVVLTHRNLETGETVTSRNANNEVSDFTEGTVTITGLPFNYKGSDGKILIKNAGRIVLGPSGVEFEAGQHPELEPDFITFICTALS